MDIQIFQKLSLNFIKIFYFQAVKQQRRRQISSPTGRLVTGHSGLSGR